MANNTISMIRELLEFMFNKDFKVEFTEKSRTIYGVTVSTENNIFTAYCDRTFTIEKEDSFLEKNKRNIIALVCNYL